MAAANAATNLAASRLSGGTPLTPEFQIARNLQIWGVIFVVLGIAYCFIRPRFPKIYNPRNEHKRLNCELASRETGTFSWIWVLWRVSEEELIDQCGLDAVCHLRWLQVGLTLSLVGSFNIIWIVPVLATAEWIPDTSALTTFVNASSTNSSTNALAPEPATRDVFTQLSLGNVNANSPRLVAPFLGAYILFGVAMWLIKREFHWFVGERHKFQTRKQAHNYSIYVCNLPQPMRTVGAVRDFFQRVTNGGVADVNFCYEIANLEKMSKAFGPRTKRGNLAGSKRSTPSTRGRSRCRP